jgi:hypothetical protein
VPAKVVQEVRVRAAEIGLDGRNAQVPRLPGGTPAPGPFARADDALLSSRIAAELRARVMLPRLVSRLPASSRACRDWDDPLPGLAASQK